MHIPYTYLIGWSKLNKWYYGCRYAKNCFPGDLWNPYKTSSKYVHELVKNHGDPDIIQVRKVFNNAKKCIIFEKKVIRKIIKKDYFINKNVAGAIIGGNTSPRTKKQKDSARKLMTELGKKPKGKWYNNEKIFARKRRTRRICLGYPQYFKDKISKTRTGQKHSAETKEKIRNAALKRKSCS